MMKTLFIALFFLVLNARPDIIDKGNNVYHSNIIIAKDQELNKLIYEGNSLAAAAYYHDDFILITSMGTQRNKQEILDQIAMPTLKMQINETLNPKVRVAGETAVLIGTLHQKYILNDREYDYKMIVTDTWVKKDNTWLLFSGQANLIK